MRPTAKDPSQFEFPVGPKVPYEDPKRCVSLRAATKREACKSTKLCTKQGHGWKLFISGTSTKRTLLPRDLPHLLRVWVTHQQIKLQTVLRPSFTGLHSYAISSFV